MTRGKKSGRLGLHLGGSRAITPTEEGARSSVSAPPPSTWIRFEELPIPPGRKTKVFGVVKKGEPKGDDGDFGLLHELGQIRWWGAWRRYSFFPADGTLFESTCLRDIAAFCDWLMASRKEAR